MQNLEIDDNSSEVIDKFRQFIFNEFKNRKELKLFLVSNFGEKFTNRNLKDIVKYTYNNPLHKIRLTYQQLKQNYEDRKSYTEAGDFHYGEMENYRKSIKLNRYFPLTILNLYKFACGYGQNYIRAGIVLVLMLLIFSNLHLFLGLEPSAHNHNSNSFDYNFNEVFRNNDSILNDFYLTVVYCTEVLVREEEPDRLFRPRTTNGDAINTFFSLVIYIQVVLFTLALRRHFKR